MYSVKDKEQVLKKYFEDLQEKLDTSLNGVDLGAYMKADSVDNIRNCMKKVKACFDSVIPEGFPIPKVSMYVSPLGTEDQITSVSLSITNRVSSLRKFKFSSSIQADNAMVDAIGFFKYVYGVLVEDLLIEANIERVNEVLASAAQRAGVQYDVFVVAPLGADRKKLSVITDEEICFVVDSDRIFNTEDVLVLQDIGGSITEEVMDVAIQQIANEFATAQTTEQLVAIHGGVLLQYICNISKHVKPMTLIKKVCNRNVMNYRGNKPMVTYYSDGDIFALLSKEAGNYEVVLSPFDIKTFRKVDMDLVAAVKAKMAE